MWVIGDIAVHTIEYQAFVILDVYKCHCIDNIVIMVYHVITT